MSTAIKSKYPKYQIYTEHVEQGFQEPCFFIALVSKTYYPALLGRNRIVYSMAVHFFPEEGSENAVSDKVTEDLQDILQSILSDKGNPFLGRAMSMQMEDGIAHFYVTYQAIMVEQSQGDYMKEVTVHGKIRETGK